MPVMPTKQRKPTYAKPNGKPQLFSYHAPADVYEYVLKIARERGVSRNMAITLIVEEHRDRE